MTEEKQKAIEAAFWRGATHSPDSTRVVSSTREVESYPWGNLRNEIWEGFLLCPEHEEFARQLEQEAWMLGRNAAQLSLMDRKIEGDGELFWQEREPLRIEWVTHKETLFLGVSRRGNFGRKPAGYEWPVTP
jgi:hypothetical protein